MPGPLVSVIITTLDEGKHLRDLLDSLVVQEPPYEVLIVDAGSRDETVPIARRFEREFDGFRLLERRGSRGHSRNQGAQAAKGEYLAFIDGDCIANAFWLKGLRARARADRVVAGRTIQFGYWAFERLERVELLRRGYDITYPSCNLLYPREAFVRLGGFDPRFVTAEDIDLNFRAVEAGLSIDHTPEAVVYHRARDSVSGFVTQAFWNGYGRKQLTLKHGSLWGTYSLQRMMQGHVQFWGLVRMSAAVLGYFRCKMRERAEDWRRRPVLQAQQVTA